MNVVLYIWLPGSVDDATTKLSSYGIRDIVRVTPTDPFPTGSTLAVAQLANGDDRWKDLVSRESARVGRAISYRLEAKYSEDELNLAQYLQVWCTSAEQDTGHGPWEHELDFSAACPRCWTGARPSRPFGVIPPRHRPTIKMCQSMMDYVLITKDLAESMVAAIPSIAPDLVATVHRKTGQPLPWFAMWPRHRISVLSQSTTGLIRGSHERERPCEVCNQDGWFHTPKQLLSIALSRARLTEDATNPDGSPCDVLWSKESLSIGRRAEETPPRIRVACGLLIVSQAVRQALLNSGTRGVSYIPIAST